MTSRKNEAKCWLILWLLWKERCFLKLEPKSSVHHSCINSPRLFGPSVGREESPSPCCPHLPLRLPSDSCDECCQWAPGPRLSPSHIQTATAGAAGKYLHLVNKQIKSTLTELHCCNIRFNKDIIRHTHASYRSDPESAAQRWGQRRFWLWSSPSSAGQLAGHSPGSGRGETGCQELSRPRWWQEDSSDTVY